MGSILRPVASEIRRSGARRGEDESDRRRAALRRARGKHKEGEGFGDLRFCGPSPFCLFSNGLRILPARCFRRHATFDVFRAYSLFFFSISFGAPRNLRIEVLFRQDAGQTGEPRGLARAALLAPRRKSNMIARSGLSSRPPGVGAS